jgi:hypothetical protein
MKNWAEIILTSHSSCNAYTQSTANNTCTVDQPLVSRFIASVIPGHVVVYRKFNMSGFESPAEVFSIEMTSKLPNGPYVFGLSPGESVLDMTPVYDCRKIDTKFSCQAPFRAHPSLEHISACKYQYQESGDQRSSSHPRSGLMWRQSMKDLALPGKVTYHTDEVWYSPVKRLLTLSETGSQ